MSTDIISTLTIGTSVLGFCVAIAHSVFYASSGNPLARKMSFVFASDAAIYAITAAFGFWALFHWSFDTAIILHWVRVPILMVNIWAAWRLYHHYMLINPK